MSLEYDSHSHMRAFFVFEDAVIAGDGVSAEIDMGDAAEGLGFRSLTYVVTIGTVLTNVGTVEIRPQESLVTGTGFTDITANADDGASQIIGGVDLVQEAGVGIVVPIAAVTTAFRLGVISKQQFQRVAITIEGAVTTGQISIVAILGHPITGPVPGQAGTAA